MSTSRQAVRAILSLALGTQLLMACNLPSPQERELKEGEGATFVARAAAEKSKVLESSVKGPFQLPYQKVYNFQACVKDVGHDKPISGHEFYISETKATVTSDKDGCVTWAEKYDYNFLGESTYVKIERTIEGRGLQKGKQKISFAINPWSHGENLTPVLNPDDGNEIPGLVTGEKAVANSLKGFNRQGAPVIRPLWVEDGRLFVTEQKLTKEGIELLVEMRPNVTLQLTKMNGELISPLRALSAGQFKATLSLIHIYQHNNQEIRRVLAGSNELSIQMQNGSLSVKAPLLLQAIPTRGQILLGLHLEPVNGPAELAPFEGLYLVGEYDQVKGASFLKLHTEAAQKPNFKLSDYVTSSLSQPQTAGPDGKIDDDTYQKPKVEVAQLEFKFIRVGEERTTTREVVYSIKACLKNGLDQKTTRSHTFQVTKFKQKTSDTAQVIDIKTDNNSCLNWDEKIQFRYFECQHYIPGFIQIANADLGMNEKLNIIVNPWESSVGAIARDMRYVDPTEPVIKTCDATGERRPRTQLMLDNFAYNALSYNYGIDHDLGLKVSKKFQMRIEPRVLSYSSLSNGRAESQRLRDGIYLVRLVVVQNREYSQSLNNYVTSAEKLVNVISGQINTDFTFMTEDLKALGNRNNILIEVLPVIDEKIQVKGSEISPIANETLESVEDHGTGLESPVFVGPILLNADDASRPLRILDPQSLSHYLVSGRGSLEQKKSVSLKEIIRNGKDLLAQSKAKLAQLAQKQVFAQNNNMQLISLYQIGSKSLQQLLKPDSKLDPRLHIQKEDLQQFLTAGQLSANLAQKLCAFWAQDYLNSLVPGKKVLQEVSPRFGYDCFQAVRRNPSDFFNWEKRLLVKEVAKVEYVQGLNQGLNIGSSFNLGYSKANSYTESFSVSAKGGFSWKFLSLFSVGVDGGYNVNWSESTSRSAGNSMSVNGNTTLSVQENTYRIHLKRYEQCALVKLNPLLFTQQESSGWFKKKRSYMDILNPTLSESELRGALSRGLMICEGQDSREPTVINENYYLLSQETYMAQMQDSGDDRNRQFFMGIRSKQDFEAFVNATKSTIVMPNGSRGEEASSETGLPLLRVMRGVVPQAPGMYRL